MRQLILSSVVIGILVAVTGCGASGRSTRTVMTPMSNVADLSHDPSWAPPGEEWSFKATEETVKTRPSTVAISALPLPNRQAIASGQVHVAY